MCIKIMAVTYAIEWNWIKHSKVRLQKFMELENYVFSFLHEQQNEQIVNLWL